jgi:hypothetical protein
MLGTLIGHVLIVTAIAVPLLYGLYCLLAGRRLRIDPYLLLLNMSGAFLVMSIMEASFGYLHTQVFGWRLWEYQLLPNHRGYGSDLGPMTWPWYGFHFYLFNEALHHRQLVVVRRGAWLKGSITGIDGPLLEILGNGLFVLLFGQYVFYYFPGELGHLTSVLVMPYYAAAGIVLVLVMRALNQAERAWGLPAALYFIGVCFVVVG